MPKHSKHSVAVVQHMHIPGSGSERALHLPHGGGVMHVPQLGPPWVARGV